LHDALPIYGAGGRGGGLLPGFRLAAALGPPVIAVGRALGGSCPVRPGLPGLVTQAHAEGDALAGDVHLHHLDLDDVTGLDHVPGVLDELFGDGGDMHQAVLVDADVDKGAEGGDVGDGT